MDAHAIALWAASHPLTVWAGGMAIALMAAAAAWAAAGPLHTHGARWTAPWADRWTAPRNAGLRLLGTLLVAALLLLACAQALAALAEEWAAPTVWALLDQTLADTLRATASVATLTLFATLTHAGDTAMLAVLAVAVAAALWLRRYRLLALGWTAALAGNGLITRGFKHTFERVRPVHTHEIAVADGFSFPSGHSSSSLVAYGMLAYLVLRLLPARWHLPAVLLAVATVFTVGWSRVVLQVHFASDVLAGWLTGGAWLACCVMVMSGVGHWHRSRSRSATLA
ncbi:phosphatase PAP2 family protein [Acidovorax sp. SUPP3334]|uniref:phosphatase PAP2 family protein n=1 Tax=Acidovorax sp. SUPP3334 TaxID=2920881 RepID=UPI0023DE60ED|nr:phosphatase PAP2 family protein [Acidovorax sp. SUPP3334]GKT24044.1 phosphatase PAP2 family protein [Acidovorax sp. SUPP3334]